MGDIHSFFIYVPYLWQKCGVHENQMYLILQKYSIWEYP